MNYEKAVPRKQLALALQRALPHDWEAVFAEVCPPSEPKKTVRCKPAGPRTRKRD